MSAPNLFSPSAPKQAQQAINRASYLAVVNDVRGGKINEQQGAMKLRALGVPEHKNVFSNRDAPGLGGVLHAVAKPLGLSRSTNIKTEAANVDAWQRTHQDWVRAHPDLAAAGGAPIGAVVANRQGGVVTPGTGLAAQLLGGLAQSSVNNPGGFVAAAEHPIRTAKQLGHNVEQTVTDPQHHLSNAALLAWAVASGTGSGLARLGGARAALKAGEGVKAATLRPGHAGGSLLHSPEPGVQTLHMPGAAPEGGIGPRNAIPVDRLLSRNPIVRNAPVVGQRARNARLQGALNRGPKTPRTAAGRAFGNVFNAHATVGRELRAQQRVENAIERAPRTAQAKAVHGVAHDLSRGEHAAIGVVGVEGVNAFKDTAAVIQRHIATHEGFIAAGKAPEANAAHIVDLKLAQRALEHPRPRLLKAVALTRQVSQQTEKKLIDAGHLDPMTAVGRRDKIAQIYGHDEAPQDSFFFPMSSRYTDQPLHGTPGAYSPRPGEFGSGPVKPGQHVQGIHKGFSGESVARGSTPVDVASTITDRSARVDRLLQAERTYKQMWGVASPVRRSAYDIPIRSTKQIKTELKQYFAKLADTIHATPDELANLNHEELRRLTDMLSAHEATGAGVGANIGGVRWIDRRVMANLGETSVRGPVEKLADAITNPIRTADIYVTPGYALNLVGNIGMQGITQGVKAFPSMRRAVLAGSEDGAENTSVIDSGMGSSLSRSYAVGTGPLHEINVRLAEGWNALTDLYSRRSAFYHEAGKAGFSTPEEIHALLHESVNQRKLVEVFRRANKNMVDYGSLTPVEQNTIRRLVFFYPWVSRGTLWALRTMAENPGKVFTLGELGQIGADNAHKAFPGGLPSWGEQTGFIPVGSSHGDLQKVLNLSSVNTYSTAAQAGRTVLETAKGLAGFKTSASAGLGGALTPAATMFSQAAGGDTSGRKGGLPGLIQGLPQWQALRRSGVAPDIFGPPSASYPETGAAAAAGPYLIHGAYPRGISKSALHNQWVKEQPPEQRAALHVRDQQQRLLADAKAAGVTLPKGVGRLYSIQAQRQSGYARLGSSPTQQERLSADLALAVKLGDLSASDAAEMNKNAATAKDPEIQSARRKINEAFFGGKDLSEVKRYVNAAKASRPAASAAK